MRVGLVVVALAIGCRKPPPPPEEAHRGPPLVPLQGPFESLELAFDADLPRKDVLAPAPAGPFEAIALLQLDEADPFCVVAVQWQGHWYHGERLDCAHRDPDTFSRPEGLAIDATVATASVRYRIDLLHDDGSAAERTEYTIVCALSRGAPACSAPTRP